jgi:hypothetical protein
MFSHSKNSSIVQSDDLRTKYASNKLADIMYHLNGTGRDSYIYANNGGFSEMHQLANK